MVRASRSGQGGCDQTDRSQGNVDRPYSFVWYFRSNGTRTFSSHTKCRCDASICGCEQFGAYDPSETVRGGRSHALTLPSGGGRSSLHWVVGGRTESTRRRIRVRVDEFGWVWSGTVELHSEEDGSSSSTALRLVNSNTHSFRIVRVETIVDESSPAIVVRIRPQALSGPPYRIENLSLQRIRFRQCVNKNRASEEGGEILLPYHVRPYAWDEPTSRKHLLSRSTWKEHRCWVYSHRTRFKRMW